MADQLKLDGTLYKPGDEAYEHARTRNFAINAHSNREHSSPALIAQVANVSDIQKCLAYAKEHKLKVTVRSGGHNWFGCYLQGSMLIDMKDICSLEIHEKCKTAIIGPCVLGQALNQEAAKIGSMCFSSGHCSGVALGGFLLGGGLGWFSEYYGYAAESVEAVTIVIPQGELIEASSDGDDDNADWLWLARGAACTFPGVVVSFKLKLYPVPAIVRNVMGLFPLEDFDEICKYLFSCRANHSLSNKVESIVFMAQTPPPLATVIPHPTLCMVAFSCIADSEEEFAKHAAVFRNIPSKPDVPSEFADHSFSSLSDLLAPAYPPDLHWDSAIYLVEPDKVDVAALRNAFQTKASSGIAVIGVIIGVKAVMKKPGAYGETYPGCAVMNDCGYTTTATGEEKESVTAFRKAVDEIMMPVMTRLNPLESRVNAETFAKSFVDSERILRLREKLDPDHVFFDPSKLKTLD